MPQTDTSGADFGIEQPDKTSKGTNSLAAVYLKVFFIFLIFFITVFSGLVPQKFKRFKQSQHVLSLANTFSGGVFLAIAFVHIIPETSTNYYMYISPSPLQAQERSGVRRIRLSDSVVVRFVDFAEGG